MLICEINLIIPSTSDNQKIKNKDKFEKCLEKKIENNYVENRH